MAKIVAAALLALPILVNACASPTPLYGPDTPRNGAGPPVDTRYGTPLPGVYKGY